MRILILDDSADLREAMRQLLAAEGHEVDTAADTAEAMRIHRLRAADVLITDIFMPGTDGLETIVAFRERWPRLRIVAMSGGGELAKRDYLGVAAEIGADLLVRKPFDPPAFLAAIAML